MPFDKEMGYRVVDALKQVAARHDASPARVAFSWVLRRPAVSSVIVAARKIEQLEDNIGAVDLQLSDDDVRLLDTASDPGIPYPKWMVLQLDTAEDPRSKVLYPERYAEGGPWKDLRGTRWQPRTIDMNVSHPKKQTRTWRRLHGPADHTEIAGIGFSLSAYDRHRTKAEELFIWRHSRGSVADFP